MRVAIIPAWYEPEEIGHLGIFIRDFAEELINAGHEVSIFAFTNKSWMREGSYLKKLPSGLREYFIKTKNGINHVLKQKKYLLALIEKTQKEFGKFDLVNTHGLISLKWAYFIKVKFHLKIVHIEHLSSLIKPPFSFKLCIQARLLYRIPHVIIGITTAQVEQIKKLTKTSVKYLLWLVHPNFLKYPFHHGRTNEYLKLICVSDLDDRKGHHLLIEACKLVEKRYPKFILSILGEGPLLNDLKVQSKRLGLSSKIVFHGKVNRYEILANLAESHLYVSGVKLENFGTHLAEAASMGLFVVCTNSIGPNDYLTEQNSIVVDEYNSHRLATEIMNGIEKIRTTEKIFFRNQIQSVLEPDRFIKGFEDIVKNMMKLQ